jgi:hypothetical protein
MNGDMKKEMATFTASSSQLLVMLRAVCFEMDMWLASCC